MPCVIGLLLTSLLAGARTLAQTPIPAPGGQTIASVLRHAGAALWVGAHPDDETSSGGLLARAVDLSGALHLATLTRGENSDILWGGLHRGSEIGQARAALFQDAAVRFAAAGVHIGPFVNGPHTLAWLDANPDAPFQGWPDGTPPETVIAKWQQEGDPVAWLVGLLRACRPDVVISMDGYCGVSGNVEHLAVARLLEQAIGLARSADAYPQVGPPWTVHWWIRTAYISDPLEACGRCKCVGSEPAAPVVDVFSLDDSRTHGMTYFRVACCVARNYENVMLERNWSQQQIDALCDAAEQAAWDAWNAGQAAYPVLEPYRVRMIPRLVPGLRLSPAP